jgi:hypothetical protein
MPACCVWLCCSTGAWRGSTSTWRCYLDRASWAAATGKLDAQLEVVVVMVSGGAAAASRLKSHRGGAWLQRRRDGAATGDVENVCAAGILFSLRPRSVDWSRFPCLTRSWPGSSGSSGSTPSRSVAIHLSAFIPAQRNIPSVGPRTNQMIQPRLVAYQLAVASCKSGQSIHQPMQNHARFTNS